MIAAWRRSGYLYTLQNQLEWVSNSNYVSLKDALCGLSPMTGLVLDFAHRSRQATSMTMVRLPSPIQNLLGQLQKSAWAYTRRFLEVLGQPGTWGHIWDKPNEFGWVKVTCPSSSQRRRAKSETPPRMELSVQKASVGGFSTAWICLLVAGMLAAWRTGYLLPTQPYLDEYQNGTHVRGCSITSSTRFLYGKFHLESRWICPW